MLKSKHNLHKDEGGKKMSQTSKIISPIPGIFYRKPSPEEAVFVNEGDMVEAGDTIGLVEVMKSFHEIKAETSGKISDFSLENEAMVEAGQEIATITEA